MVARKLAPLATLILLAVPWEAAGQSLPFSPAEEKPEDYPVGRGRDETFYACTPCHGFRIVAQQGQTRRQWNDTLEWMTERFNMPSPAESDRNTMLDYLESAFPPRAGPRRWQNPFQK